MPTITAKRFDNREAWAEARNRSLGGSDVPVLFNAGFISPLELKLQKQGVIQSFPDGVPLRLRIGLAVEEEIAQEMAKHPKLEGLNVVAPANDETPVTYHRDDLPWLHATPDRLLLKTAPKRRRWETLHEKAEALLSLKTVGGWMAQHWDEHPPALALIQAQVEMMLTGIRTAYVGAAFDWGHKVEVYGPYPYHEALAEKIERVSRIFWQRCVLEDEPVPDIRPGDKKLLSQLIPQSIPNKVVDLRTIAAIPGMLEDRKAFKAQAKDLNEAAETIDAKLMLLMGDAEAAIVDDSTMLSWKTAPREGYVVEPTTTRTFRVQKPTKAVQAIVEEGNLEPPASIPLKPENEETPDA